MLDKGDQVLNTRTGNKERIGRILEMHANERQDVDRVYTGDIAAGIGFKDTKTGDTLCGDQQPDRARAARVPRARHPTSRSSRRPRSTRTRWPRRSSRCPRKTRPSGSTPTKRPARPSSAAWASCTSRCSSTACCASSRSTPPSASRRWPTARPSRRRRSDVTYTHKKQTGGSGQFAEVTIDLEPNEVGKGYEFIDKITGGRIPREYIPAVDQGCQGSDDARACSPATRWSTSRSRCSDGKYHDVDSSEMAFKIAGIQAFKEACAQGQARPSSSRSWPSRS